MLIFPLLWKPNWTLPFLLLSLFWMVKVKHIPLADRNECGVIYLQKEITGKPVAEHKSRHDIDVKSIELNLKKISGCFSGHIT